MLLVLPSAKENMKKIAVSISVIILTLYVGSTSFAQKKSSTKKNAKPAAKTQPKKDFSLKPTLVPSGIIEEAGSGNGGGVGSGRGSGNFRTDAPPENGKTKKKTASSSKNTNPVPCEESESSDPYGVVAGQNRKPPATTVKKDCSNIGPTTELRILAKPQPAYTKAARESLVTGSVRLRVTFLASGQIGSVAPIQGLPYGLTEAAIKAAQLIKFEPKKVNGVPVSIVRMMEYNFTIY